MPRTRAPRARGFAKIERFDDDGKKIRVTPGMKVKDLLAEAGIEIHDGEEINDFETGVTVNANTRVKQGQEFVITGNYKSGK